MGYPSAEVCGRHTSVLYVGEDRTAADAEFAQTVAEGRTEIEDWRVRKDGSLFWAFVVTTPLYDSAGELVGFSKVTRDLTAKKEADEARSRLIEREREVRKEAEAAAAWARFIAEAGKTLAGTLDIDDATRTVAQIACSEVADWCIIYLANDSGELIASAATHCDPAREATLHDLMRTSDVNFAQNPVNRVM